MFGQAHADCARIRSIPWTRRMSVFIGREGLLEAF
jgi:hypothetical protein